MSDAGDVYATVMPNVCTKQEYREWILDRMEADGVRLLALVDEGERPDPDAERGRLAEIQKICGEWDFDLSDMFDDRTTVLSFGWSPEVWGHAGGVWIDECEGLYFFASSDYDPDGPFLTIDEALDAEPFSYGGPNPDLESSVLSLDELKAIARGMENPTKDEDYRICINDVMYAWQDGDFVPAPEDHDE